MNDLTEICVAVGVDPSGKTVEQQANEIAYAVKKHYQTIELPAPPSVPDTPNLGEYYGLRRRGIVTTVYRALRETANYYNFNSDWTLDNLTIDITMFGLGKEHQAIFQGKALNDSTTTGLHPVHLVSEISTDKWPVNESRDFHVWKMSGSTNIIVWITRISISTLRITKVEPRVKTGNNPYRVLARFMSDSVCTIFLCNNSGSFYSEEYWPDWMWGSGFGMGSLELILLTTDVGTNLIQINADSVESQGNSYYAYMHFGALADSVKELYDTKRLPSLNRIMLSDCDFVYLGRSDGVSLTNFQKLYPLTLHFNNSSSTGRYFSLKGIPSYEIILSQLDH